MAEIAENTENEKKPEDSGQQMWSLVLMVFVCTLTGKVLEKNFGIEYSTALFLSYAVYFMVSYWIPPKPAVSYWKWVLSTSFLIFLLWLAIYVLPEPLSRVIWRPLAYALPIFLLCMSIPWLPGTFARSKEEPFWQWLLLALAFGLLLGIPEYYSSN